MTKKDAKQAMKKADGDFIVSVGNEVNAARAMWPDDDHKLDTFHRAYGVILEELDEFWEIVKQKRHKRNPKDALKELRQVAAMCCRAATDLGLMERAKEGGTDG